jgi:hypothetical protein
VPVVITAARAAREATRDPDARAVAAIVLLVIMPIGYFTVGGFYRPGADAVVIAASRVMLAALVSSASG